MIEESVPASTTNRAAVISMVLALLTIVALCVGIAPIPFTGFICVPAAAVLGGLAFAAGIASLNQIRSSRGNGATMALVATGIGALGAIGAACAMIMEFLGFLKILAYFTSPCTSGALRTCALANRTALDYA